MRISYLREFISLSKYLNYSLAAERLHMTQSGLSRHISMLEKEIGIKLFDRDTHSVKLTEKGELFSKGIQNIVADYDLLCERVVKLSLTQLCIGVPYFGVSDYLSNVVTDFENAHQNIKLSYLMAYPDEVVDGLLSKKVDVAVIPHVDFVNSDRLTFHDAFKESLALVLNRNHPLARKKSIRIRDLGNESFISIKGNYGHALFEYQYDFCRRRGFEPKVMMAMDTIEAAVLKMKPDAGVMLLPGHVKHANISCNIQWVDIIDEDCFFNVSLVHHHENQDTAVHQFIEYYLKQVKQKKMG